METEVVLFLRRRVGETALQAALAEAFAPDLDDDALIVHFPQGFATGISVMCDEGLAVDRAEALSNRLDSAVLLEDPRTSQWLLFTPGAPAPEAVQVIELRHGLDVAAPARMQAAAASALCA